MSLNIKVVKNIRKISLHAPSCLPPLKNHFFPSIACLWNNPFVLVASAENSPSSSLWFNPVWMLPSKDDVIKECSKFGGTFLYSLQKLFDFSSLISFGVRVAIVLFSCHVNLEPNFQLSSGTVLPFNLFSVTFHLHRMR